MLCSEEVNSLFHRINKTSILCRSDKKYTWHTLGFLSAKEQFKLFTICVACIYLER